MVSGYAPSHLIISSADSCGWCRNFNRLLLSPTVLAHRLLEPFAKCILALLELIDLLLQIVANPLAGE